MKFGLWTQNGALNSQPVFDAFKQGAVALGHTCAENSYDADAAVIWSVLWTGRMRYNQQVFAHFKKIKKPVVVLEVGALKRNELWRVSVENTFFGHETDNNDQRLKKLGINIEPWRESLKNSKILICCQNTLSYQWSSMPENSLYLENIISDIRKFTDRLITIRPHPRYPLNSSEFFRKFSGVDIQRPMKLKDSYDSYDFEQSLKKSWCVVNHNSNPAVISAIKGTPVFVASSSLAAPVGNLDFSDIEKPKMPDRTQWANNIAYTEWTVDEIASGLPLMRLIDKLKS